MMLEQPGSGDRAKGAKLTNSQAWAIRDHLRAFKGSRQERAQEIRMLANEHRVSEQTIRNIASGKTYQRPP